MGRRVLSAWWGQNLMLLRRGDLPGVLSVGSAPNTTFSCFFYDMFTVALPML